MIFDTHTHYDDEQFAEDREALLLSLKEQGVGAVANMGASMRGAEDSVALAEKYPFVYAAVGIHPDHAKELDEAGFEKLRALAEKDKVVAIGEIGLDFGWRHLASRGAQLDMFAAIARWAAERGGKLLSLHSIKAARETLDVLEREGALANCCCIFHWFSGPSDLLRHAIDAGCFFSCGPRMLATGKGREYVKAIPADQLLPETDAPPSEGAAYPFDSLYADLESVAASIAAIKGEAALDTIARTSEQLLVFP